MIAVLQTAGNRTASIGTYLNGYGDQPLRPSGRASRNDVPPGWTRWRSGSDRNRWPGDPFAGGTYDYVSLTQDIDGTIASFPGATTRRGRPSSTT